jgi:hypothetical protein
MGGGKGIPMLIFTSALAGIGAKIANAKRNVPKKSSLFILFSSFSGFSSDRTALLIKLYYKWP